MIKVIKIVTFIIQNKYYYIKCILIINFSRDTNINMIYYNLIRFEYFEGHECCNFIVFRTKGVYIFFYIPRRIIHGIW